MYDILVNTITVESWPLGAQYGARLAALMQASVTGAYIYPLPLYATPSFSSPELIGAVVATALTLEAKALDARQPFIDWANSMGVKHADWTVGQGNLSEALMQIACWNDLLVLERDPDRTWATAADLALVLLAVRRPCIVVPPQPVQSVSLSRIAIAWNGAPEAMRAVHAALPLLRRADEVLVLRGASKETFQEVTWKPPFDIDIYLRRHGIHARSQALDEGESDAGEAVLEQAGRFQANLVVMGAYGRSRFSEWALGGATRHVLWNAPLPVLFHH